MSVDLDSVSPPRPQPPRTDDDDVKAKEARASSTKNAAMRDSGSHDSLATAADAYEAASKSNAPSLAQSAPRMPRAHRSVDASALYARSSGDASSLSPQSGTKEKDGKLEDNDAKALDQQMRDARVPPAQRQRIVDHLKTLSGDELAKERATVDHALQSKNADRALATYDSLLSIAKSDPNGKRLDADTRGDLVRGVADARSGDDERGLLGKRQAEDAARAMLKMPQEQLDRLKGVLGKAASGDEKALVLKAVGARKSALGGPNAAKAMDTVENFAGKIRGMDHDALIGATTAAGHYQRYDSSCGPTTAQSVRAEKDPVYAMWLKENGKRGVDNDVSREQKEVLERPRFYDKNDNWMKVSREQEDRYLKTGELPKGAAGAVAGVAASRQGEAALEQLSDRVNGKWGMKNLSASERRAVNDYAQNRKQTADQERLAQQTIERIRNGAGAGHPTKEEVTSMRSNYERNPDGTSTPKHGDGMNLENALDDIAPRGDGKSWEPRDAKPKGGLSDKNLADMDTRLRDGTEVPIRIGEPGHFMTVNDVRGDAGNRSYRVSDPWTGKSEWVKESELKNPRSDWYRKHFSDQPANAKVTGYYVGE